MFFTTALQRCTVATFKHAPLSPWQHDRPRLLPTTTCQATKDNDAEHSDSDDNESPSQPQGLVHQMELQVRRVRAAVTLPFARAAQRQRLTKLLRTQEVHTWWCWGVVLGSGDGEW